MDIQIRLRYLLAPKKKLSDHNGVASTRALALEVSSMIDHTCPSRLDLEKIRSRGVLRESTAGKQ
jgi:hypothetical protein